jgi:hypothetical protein
MSATATTQLFNGKRVISLVPMMANFNVRMRGALRASIGSKGNHERQVG